MASTHYVFGRGYAEHPQDASKQKIFRRSSVIQGMRAARALKRTCDEGAIDAYGYALLIA